MKSELLAKITQGGTVKKSMVEVASQSWTAESVAARFKELKRRNTVFTKTANGATVAAFVLGFGVACAWILEHFNESETGGIPLVICAAAFALFISLVASVVGVGLCALPFEYAWRRPFELDALTPIAGTVQCEYSLKDLEVGGPQVEQWRDVAVAERGQLHRMDAYIMSALRTLHEAEQSEITRKVEVDEACRKQVARKAEVDEACRKLHGLAPTKPQ